MFGRRILGVLVAAVLLLLGISGCLISATSSVQAMQCCTQLTCAPGQQKPSCLATTAPSDGPQTLPEVRTSLATPSITADLHPLVEDLSAMAFNSAGMADAPQHSPPELYTLHLALLI